MSASSVPIAAASQPFPSVSEEGISKERFAEILDDSYSVVDRNNVRITGKNKHGHTLVLRGGFVHCEACKKKLSQKSGGVARHIVCKTHRNRVFPHLRLQENQDEDSVGGDSVAGSDERAMQAENSNPNYDKMQDASDGMGKKSATSKEKTPTETADGNGDSENALPVQDGLLVVNGFDVVKYIRGLEGRISELEAMLEAANAVPSTENDDIA